MKLFLCCVLWLAFGWAAHAMPAPPLEAYLERAETISLARIIAVGGGSITFRPTQALRGDLKNEVTLTCLPPNVHLYKIGSEVLLASQGDARFGAPRPTLEMNTPSGQTAWCGWLTFGVIRVSGEFYAGCFSFVDGEPYTDTAPDGQAHVLSQSRIERLIRKFPYNPHINDKD